MWTSRDAPPSDVGALPASEESSLAATSAHAVRDGRSADGWRADASGRVVLLASAVVVAAAVVGGAILGLLWFALAPAVEVVVGPDSISVSEAQSGRIFAREGAFAALTVAAGVIAATAVARWVRRTGPLAVIVLVVAGLAGSVVAWRVGVWAGPAPVDSLSDLAVGEVAELPLVLRSYGLLLLWPITSVFVTMWVAVVSLVTSSPPAVPPDDGATPDPRDP